MASNSNSAEWTDFRPLIECPVCVQTFRNPKSLTCGHSVCFECCRQLRTATYVVCPVCRSRTVVPPDGLPTNFCLQNLIEHHVSQQEDDKKYACNKCKRKHPLDDCWVCVQCNSALICAGCVVIDHHSHTLQQVNNLIERRREELAEWRQRIDGVTREIENRRRQIEANQCRIDQRAVTMNGTLRTKLQPRFAEAMQQLNTEMENLLRGVTEIDVSDIIGGNGGAACQFENQLNEVPQKMEAFKNKQEQLMADQRLALEVVQNCNEVLRQILSPKKPEGETASGTTAVGAAAASANSDQSAEETASRNASFSVFSVGARPIPRLAPRGRIFPPLSGESEQSASPRGRTYAWTTGPAAPDSFLPYDEDDTDEDEGRATSALTRNGAASGVQDERSGEQARQRKIFPQLQLASGDGAQEFFGLVADRLADVRPTADGEMEQAEELRLGACADDVNRRLVIRGRGQCDYPYFQATANNAMQMRRGGLGRGNFGPSVAENNQRRTPTRRPRPEPEISSPGRGRGYGLFTGRGRPTSGNMPTRSPNSASPSTSGGQNSASPGRQQRNTEEEPQASPIVQEQPSSDSSDNDGPSEPIMFHTFLTDRGDKNKRQN